LSFPDKKYAENRGLNRHQIRTDNIDYCAILHGQGRGNNKRRDLSMQNSGGLHPEELQAEAAAPGQNGTAQR
jgi:hypothetical protein